LVIPIQEEFVENEYGGKVAALSLSFRIFVGRRQWMQDWKVHAVVVYPLCLGPLPAWKGRQAFGKRFQWFFYEILHCECIGILADIYNYLTVYTKSRSGERRRVKRGVFSCLTGN
jgi:hypothetical protein